MWWSIIIFLSFGFLYIIQKRYYHEVYKEILLYISVALVMVNFLSRRETSIPFESFEALMAITLLFFLSYTFYTLSKAMDLLEQGGLSARQVSYWGISPQKILNKNKHKIIEKKGRNEFVEEVDEYFYEEVIVEGKRIRKLQPLILSDIKAYKGFTIISSLKYFKQKKNSELYIKIYNKLNSINEEIEAELDFEKILIDNKYCIEFFLIDLWEVLCSKEIIGVGTLNTIARNKKELELIGALDASVSTNVQREGILLYSHYLRFKGALTNV